MKLFVLIGTDCHLKQLPHFLAHYAAIGVDQFVCGLHGHGADQARALLVRHPFVIVADYVEIHHHIFAPDEVFFHTLVKHSPFASAITQDFSDGIYPNHFHHGNHFIDWAGRRKRTRLTLDERDFDDLLASPALFARKFDEQTSNKLLDLLDGHVHCPCVKESVKHG